MESCKVNHANSKFNTIKPAKKQMSPTAVPGPAQKTHIKGQPARRQPNTGKKSNNRIGLHNLTEMLEMPPNTLALRLVNSSTGLKDFLRISLADEATGHLITLLQRAFECHSLKLRLIALVDTVVNSKFFSEHLCSYLGKKNSAESTRSVLSLCSSFVLFSPEVVTNLRKFTAALKTLIETQQGGDESLQRDWQSFFNQTKQHSKSPVKTRNPVSSEPPGDFTKLSVIPNSADIIDKSNEEPFLRKNIIQGKLLDFEPCESLNSKI
jgi:hypothetical protein